MYQMSQSANVFKVADLGLLVWKQTSKVAQSLLLPLKIHVK